MQTEDPVAIVGMACRLPGDIRSPSDLWNLLETGRSAQSDVPANRFSVDAWYHPDASRNGSILAKGGYFLGEDESFLDFEPSFFGINPAEAASMDPQQRKLLEVVYETFESAGVTLDQISGSQTACYVGAFTRDFNRCISRDLQQHFPYESTGSDLTILSNRVNYVFNLKGPSLTVDTACSSSLYALHLARQGLLLGDFKAAIVAGTNIIMDVSHQLTATKLGILSPTSTCHTFDAQADGFGRAEGITALYLKRVSDAVSNGDPIRGIIRGSAINTNGRGLGISHPSALGQEAVIRQAYSNAGLELEQTAYVECHGTGTPVGDPTEVSAVGNVFHTGRTLKNPLLLSGLKSQIGHTEGASGIAAVQKVVLSLENRIVPATIGISQVNPAINLRNGSLKIVQTAEEWPHYAPYLRASINSFGYGGANAHVIVDSAQSYFFQKRLAIQPDFTLKRSDAKNRNQDNVQLSDSAPTRFLLISSAKSRESLRRNIAATYSHAVLSRYSLRDLTYTVATKRTLYRHRAFAIASADTDQSNLEDAKWVIDEPKVATAQIAFVFTGQGAQWPKMGVELVHNFEVVRQTFKTLQEDLNSIPEQLEWTIYDALCQPASTSQMMTEVVVTVTLCTAIQIALVNLFRSWSVHPIAVVGHSSGEAAAAYCAGHLTMTEAIITSYYRALALKRNQVPGMMMAVGLGANEVSQYLQAKNRTMYLACQNSPQSVTLSGDGNSIDELEAELKQAGVFARKIKSSGFGNHSPLVETAARHFQQNFQHALPSEHEMSLRTSKIPMYSCITGEKVTSRDVGIEYWAKNISAPVLFDQALQRLLTSETAVNHVIEIGPHSALSGPIRQIKTFLGIDNQRLSYLPSLIRGNDGVEDVLRLAGHLFSADYPVDVVTVNSASSITKNYTTPRHIVDLPFYQWNYDQVHWAEPRLSREVRFRKHSRHDLLGSLEPSSTSTSLVWRNRLQLSHLPWIGDHKIGESTLLPFSGVIAMALEAAQQFATNAGHVATKITLWNVSIKSPVIFAKDETVEIVFELHVNNDKLSHARRSDFRVSSISSDGDWRQHSTGSLSYEEKEQVIPRVRAESIAEESIQSNIDIYTKLRGLGLNYGPCFQTLHNVCELQDRAVQAKINMKPTRHIMDHESSYMVHPATMDGCLQAASAASLLESSGNVLRSYLPSQVISMSIYPNVSREIDDVGSVCGQAKIGGLRFYEAGCQLHHEDGRILCTIEARFNAVEGLHLDDERKSAPEPYQRLRWLPDIDRLQGSFGENEFLGLHTSTFLGSSDAQSNHLAEQRAEHHIRLICFQKLLQLLVFKRPNLNILETGYGSATNSGAVLRAIHPGVKNRLYRTLTIARAKSELIDEIATLQGDTQGVRWLLVDFEKDWGPQGLEPKSFDIVIVSITSTEGFPDLLKYCRGSLSPDGQLVIFQESTIPGLSYDKLNRELLEAGFSGIRIAVGDMSVILSVANSEQSKAQRTLTPAAPENLYLVHINNGRLVDSLRSPALDMGFNSVGISLSDIASLPHGARTLTLMELEAPLFSGLDEQLLSSVKTLFRRASSVMWITSRGRPEYSLILGMAQVLRTEVPALQLTCVEVNTTQDEFGRNAKAIMQYEAVLRSGFTQNENHVILQNRVFYISRYVVDEDLNRYDVLRTRGAVEYEKYAPGLCLDMRKIGDTETSFFRENRPRSGEAVDQEHVRVTVLTYSLSRQNAMTLRAQNHAHYFSHECFGRVETVGPGSTLKVGESVVCLARTRMNSEVDVPENLSIPCETEQHGEELVGLLEPICKAWNAIIKLGRLASGKILLIHSSDLLLNLVGAAIAQTSGVKVLMTPKPALETNALKMHLHIDDQAFVDPSSTAPLLSQYPDKIDVFFDTDGDLDLKSIEHVLAPNGHIIKTDAAAHNAYSDISPGMLSGGVTLSVFDMMTMVEKNTKAVAGLIQKGIKWLRTNELCMPKLALYQFGTLSKAVTDALNPQLDQRVAIRWTPETTVPVYRTRQSSLSFSNDGVYLLVGCLGGLGRCLSLWMQRLGACNFIFLSRTADDESEAASLVGTLRERPGVNVKVIRGDVSNRKDVQRAVGAGDGRLRGVIQAAGVFNDSRFASMSLQQWNAVFQPKVQGTANLHEETIGQPLDFFVMTSSSLGLSGASSQSAYAAANMYLDNMARYRRQNGLPATSLSLGMVVGVGHVEQEVGLEAILRRRGGSYGISEAEFLRMMEVAIQCPQGSVSKDRIETDSGIDRSLIVTGLDPSRLSPSEVQRFIEDDTRFRHIKRAVAQNHSQKGPEPSSRTRSESADFELLKTLRESGTSNHDSTRHSALQACVLPKLSSLILIPTEQLRDSLHRPLEDLGLDSIVGSEFQAWTWRELRVQLDFMEVFASGRSLESLVDSIDAGLSPLQPSRRNDSDQTDEIVGLQ